MASARPIPAPDRAPDEARLVAQARALQAKLDDTFERLLQSLGLTRAELADHMRRLERDPAGRRALEEARREVAVAPRSMGSGAPSSPRLPRNPRALRA